jgi:transposase
LLLHSRDQAGIRLCGPARKNSSWQTKVEGAYDMDQFVIDWDQQVVRCPQGKSARSWKETTDQTGAPLIYITFSRTACLACEARPLCTRGQKRVLGFRPREHVATPAAINLDPLFAWGTQQPRAKTRKSRFAKLVA